MKTAFVNAPLKETVYCRQVPGFEKPGTENKILLLKKALYGTKQAANAWQNFLAGILVSEGGKRCRKDECVYIFREGSAFLFLSTHVDDLFPLFNLEGKRLRDKILGALKAKMQIEDKGVLHFALDTKIERETRGNFENSQQTYTQNLLKDFLPPNAPARETPAILGEISRPICQKLKASKKK